MLGKLLAKIILGSHLVIGMHENRIQESRRMDILFLGGSIHKQ